MRGGSRRWALVDRGVGEEHRNSSWRPSGVDAERQVPRLGVEHMAHFAQGLAEGAGDPVISASPTPIFFSSAAAKALRS